MKSHFTNISGIRTHVHTVGNGKKQIVLLHGWGGSSESFFDLIQYLSSTLKEYTFIIPDLPGFGQSGVPPKSGWNSKDYAAWLGTFIESEKINDTAVLVGHSNGARTLVRYTQNQKNTKHTLVLIGSPGVHWPLTRRQKIIQRASKILKPIKYITPRFIQKIIIAKLLRAHDSFNAGKLKSTFTKIIQETDIREDLTTITNKTLLIWGAQDTYTPLKSAQVYAQNIPNNQLVILPVAKHAVHKTHAKHVARSISTFVN